jgi:hypothetical protein
VDPGDLELIGVVWHKNRAVRVSGAGIQKQGKSGERQQGFGRRGTIASPVLFMWNVLWHHSDRAFNLQG